VAAAVVWNAHGSTLIRRCDQGADHNDLSLTLFEDALKLVPNNRSLTYVTHSDWLYEQWSDMLGWKSVNYQGLDRNACPPQWKWIMGHVKTRVDEVILFAHERISWYREFVPWS
jgi:hypothetical protein